MEDSQIALLGFLAGIITALFLALVLTAEHIKPPQMQNEICPAIWSLTETPQDTIKVLTNTPCEYPS